MSSIFRPDVVALNRQRLKHLFPSEERGGPRFERFEPCDVLICSGQRILFEPEPSFPTDVSVPELKAFEGYDVVNFTAQTSPECSPLSCNALASAVETNARCLLESIEQTRTLLENGTFSNSEPGPYRIVGVYSVPWPHGG